MFILYQLQHFVQTTRTNPQNNIKSKLICPCSDVVTHRHIAQCLVFDVYWQSAIQGTACTHIDEAKEMMNTPIEEVIKNRSKLQLIVLILQRLKK